MKDYFKKIIACQLTIMMALSAGTSVSFAKKASPKIKLNKTKITLNKGKSYTLKLKGQQKKLLLQRATKRLQL